MIQIRPRILLLLNVFAAILCPMVLAGEFDRIYIFPNKTGVYGEGMGISADNTISAYLFTKSNPSNFVVFSDGSSKDLTIDTHLTQKYFSEFVDRGNPPRCVLLSCYGGYPRKPNRAAAHLITPPGATTLGFDGPIDFAMSIGGRPTVLSLPPVDNSLKPWDSRVWADPNSGKYGPEPNMTIASFNSDGKRALVNLEGSNFKLFDYFPEGVDIFHAKGVTRWLPEESWTPEIGGSRTILSSGSEFDIKPIKPVGHLGLGAKPSSQGGRPLRVYQGALTGGAAIGVGMLANYAANRYYWEPQVAANNENAIHYLEFQEHRTKLGAGQIPIESDGTWSTFCSEIFIRVGASLEMNMP